jgi:hypothetical protein
MKMEIGITLMIITAVIGAACALNSETIREWRGRVRLANTDIGQRYAAPLELDRGDNNEPGRIYLANEARFTARRFSEGLTNYGVGWRDPNGIQDTLDFLFPPVQVPKRFEWKKLENAEAFYSETDDLRAIGADFKKVEHKSSSVNDKTLNKGLTVRCEYDEWDEIPGWKELHVALLKERLLRNELRRCYTASAAAATNTAKTWDTTAGKDPDQDVLTDLIAATDSSGVRPNAILIGEVAWNKRGLSHRAQVTAGGFASAQMTPEQVAGIYGVGQGVKISRERYATSLSAKAKVVADVVLEFFRDAMPSRDDMSNQKRFWTPCRGGGMIAVYVHEEDKWADITVEHYSKGVIAHTLGLRTLTIS